ncbi:hypothetical protein LPJ54_003704 [Coemansia sp. RSA 1824]|nr:hypothetical protein LPJ54_003704 [Coemansia sp. RSA 1824]
MAVSSLLVARLNHKEPTNAGPYSAANSEMICKDDKPKPCCVCLETKKARDVCYFDLGDGAEVKCRYLVEAHKKCMADFGFKI